MNTVTLKREIQAIQWLGSDQALSDGFFEVLPEVHWSAGRDLVYFTYGQLNSRDWLGVEKLKERPATGSGFEDCCGYSTKNGETYWRKVLPFALWSVKSESQMAGRRGEPNAYRPVFLNADEAAELRLWHDYCMSQQWPKPLPRYAEFREINGSYGRGYRPHYLSPGDWLLKDADRGYSVISDDEFHKMRA